MFPTDMLVTVMDIPLPTLPQLVDRQRMPFWVQVIAAGLLGLLVGRLAAPRNRR
jgi:hypothetical protein